MVMRSTADIDGEVPGPPLSEAQPVATNPDATTSPASLR
jgi:hypothetical protein